MSRPDENLDPLTAEALDMLRSDVGSCERYLGLYLDGIWPYDELIRVVAEEVLLAGASHEIGYDEARRAVDIRLAEMRE